MRTARANWMVGCLALATLTACPGRINPSSVSDGGTDAGNDAGVIPDAGTDAGFSESDAGPPPELKILKALPPRGTTAGGTQVTLQGQGFMLGVADRATEAKKLTTLKFGSNPSLDFQVIDDETIDARLPQGVAGLTNITLTNSNGTFVCTGCFTYFDELYLLDVTPKVGPLEGENVITVTGQGFTQEVQVNFGDRGAAHVQLVSDKEFKVTVPRATTAGKVDLTVYNKNGVGQLKRVYEYFGNLRVTNVSPLVGPQAGGTAVTLTGTGLAGATSVRFGTAAGTLGATTSDTSLTVTAPAGTALGAVDLTVVTPRATWLIRGGFSYVDAAGAVQVYAVYPHLGPTAGGNTVTLTGQGLVSGLSVTIGGRTATVSSADGTTALLQIPPRSSGPRVNDVVATVAATTRTLAQAYTYQLTLASLSPTSGSGNGGTPVNVSGTNLPSDAEVFIGGSKAVTTSATDTQVSINTAYGSGGLNDVRVRSSSDPENEAVLPGAFTYAEALSVGRVQPDRGAIAGSTMVTVLGAGFGEGTVVLFGANHAKDVKIIDSHTLTCRTPKGDLGTVDIQVKRLTQQDNLPGGFSYFDPRSISGGLSGAPITGTVNLTVLDGTQGFYGAPVPLATAMLGADPSTPFQGLTDQRGQLTFSDPTLVKAQIVTVFKEGYETATVTSVNAENLTVFITRTGGDGDPSPATGGLEASVISGTVSGFKPPRPLASDEVLEARVFVSQRSVYEGPPYYTPSFQGFTWVLSQDGGKFTLYTRAGLWAVYAVLGVKNKTAFTFTPYVWGIKRGVTTSPDAPASDVVVTLDTLLDMNIPITVDNPLNIDGSAATNAVYAWLDLGAEGLIPNPTNWDTGTRGISGVLTPNPTFSFPTFPRLDGSNFLFLNVASGLGGSPQSLYYRRQPGDLTQGLTIGPMLPTE
ncbi:MAG: IPT/TIG domain-containing protein [Myxococcaceae bacterium]